MTSLWDAALSSLGQRMSSRNFELWIQPLKLVSQAGDLMTLEAPNLYLKEWFEDNYLQSVQRAICEIAGRDIEIQVLLPPASSAPEIPGPDPDTSIPIGHTAPAAPAGKGHRDLSERYRFDSFVVGPSNQFASAASQLVAERPGEKYNPLFIYGGTGLGKTHLLQAIGHALLDARPSWQVTYVTSERFVNEFIACMRLRKMDEFRERYRQRCDVLLLDDVQFFEGKDNTEQEFFHTFNALHERGRQIVITSDKPVNQMPQFKERLKSRFQWGLIADIVAPELETRISILKQKARLDHISLPDDVATFLATSIQSNVRELEGALIRLAAFSSLQGRSITVEFAERTLANLIERNRGKVSVELIQREVASYFNLRPGDLKSQRRPRAISFPRQLAMHLCRKHTSSSLNEIGRHFGGKDHTTVLCADRKIRRLSEEEPETRSTLEALERLLGL